jgi:hypothetical protein
LREAGLTDLDPSEIKMEFKGIKEALTVNISNTMQRVEALERRFDDFKKFNEELKALVDNKINALAGAVERIAVSRSPLPDTSGGNPSNPPEGKEGVQLDDERERSLKALEMLEQNMSPVDIMRVLGIDVEEMKNILANWKALSSAYTGTTTKDAMLIINKAMGESVRDVCEHYNQQTGTCMFWRLTEVGEELKRSMPTVAKGVGGKLRYNVYLHPEICASCPHGRKVGA